MSESRKYTIRAALGEDVNSPYIWFTAMPRRSREIVKITNPEKSLSVWCEVVLASDNFIERYNRNPRTQKISANQPYAIANEWYREKLGLDKNESTDVLINASSKPLFIKQILASYQHPDNTVRLAVDLAFVSVALGFIGLVLGAISLFK